MADSSNMIAAGLRKGAHVIGEASIGGGEVANGIAVLPAAVVAGTEKASIASSSLPGVGDVTRIFNAVPALGMFLGALKMLNGIRGGLIAGTTSYVYDEHWLSIPKSWKELSQSPKEILVNDFGQAQEDETLEAPENPIKRIRKEIAIEAFLEFISGDALFGLCYRAYQVAHTSTTSLLPSLALASMGFAVSSLIDLLRAARTLHEVYKNKKKLPKGESIRSQQLAILQHLLKFAGWSVLACSSALGTGPLLVVIGCALIGLSAVPQLWETLKLAGSGLYYAGTSLASAGVFGKKCNRYVIKNKENSKNSMENGPSLMDDPEDIQLEKENNAAMRPVRA